MFFAKESGVISRDEAQLWADRLAEYARTNEEPIVALVDALDVTRISIPAYTIFSKASFTPNVLEIVVATNDRSQLSSKNIGLLGKPRKTVVFATLDEAQQYVATLLQAQAKKKD